MALSCKPDRNDERIDCDRQRSSGGTEKKDGCKDERLGDGNSSWD